MKVYGLHGGRVVHGLTRIITEGNVVSSLFFLSVFIRVIRGPVLGGKNTWRIF